MKNSSPFLRHRQTCPASRGWRWLTVPVVLVCLLLTPGCRTTPSPTADWRSALQRELPLLGHRNWILVADSAYSAQNAPGVTVVATRTDQLEVLDAVLRAVDAAPHVQGHLFLDAELNRVPEDLAPGIEQYRRELARRLTGRPLEHLPHEELIARLDEAGQAFRILVLKTRLTLPYTSVFVQLDCGYWGPAAERQLREILARMQ